MDRGANSLIMCAWRVLSIFMPCEGSDLHAARRQSRGGRRGDNDRPGLEVAAPPEDGPFEEEARD